MNPFLNPYTGLPFLKNFLLDHGRLKRLDRKQVERYKDKAFRKILKYAYNIPLYNKKYKTAGIHPEDIKGIKDITKLPFITKKDLVENYPDKIIPPNYNKDKAYVVSTSGSTGKPVSVFFDFSVYSEGVGAFLRVYKTHNINWRKSRFANIGNFGQGKADKIADQIFYSKAKLVYSSKNHISINAFEPIIEIMEKLDDFKPDSILSYPVTYQNLAYLKNKGYGKNVNPKILIVSANVLDEYTRSYVEDAFKCNMYNGYGAAEISSEAAIAFECPQHTWHVNYDFYHVESIDENQDLVDSGEIGHIVVTRLFGKGTPIIRYTGLDDWIKLTDFHDCSCGLVTPTFKDGVEGRRNTSIFLADGRVFPSATFAIIGVVLKKMKSKKVKQFQIVQNKLDEIEILIVLDDDLRDTKPSNDILFEKIRQVYQQKVGPGVSIKVREVKEIKSEPNKPAPLAISYLSDKERESIFEKLK